MGLSFKKGAPKDGVTKFTPSSHLSIYSLLKTFSIHEERANFTLNLPMLEQVRVVGLEDAIKRAERLHMVAGGDVPQLAFYLQWGEVRSKEDIVYLMEAISLGLIMPVDPFAGAYVLLGGTGAGKTTLLRNLDVPVIRLSEWEGGLLRLEEAFLGAIRLALRTPNIGSVAIDSIRDIYIYSEGPLSKGGTNRGVAAPLALLNTLARLFSVRIILNLNPLTTIAEGQDELIEIISGTCQGILRPKDKGKDCDLIARYDKITGFPCTALIRDEISQAKVRWGEIQNEFREPMNSQKFSIRMV